MAVPFVGGPPGGECARASSVHIHLEIIRRQFDNIASCQYSVSMKREDLMPIHTEAASQFAAFIPNLRVVTDGEAVEVASLIADHDIRTGLLAE
jgi:phage FluMu protein gp41